MIPLSYGKPVVASDLAIFREIAERGDCIELVPNRDSRALAAVIDRLLNDPGRRAELSEKAKDFARSHSWPAMARRTIEVYRSAIADAARPLPV
jgi:phosphatidylinositol alpha-mannosyltransferase